MKKLIWLILMLFICGCSHFPPRKEEAKQPKSLIIFVDELRNFEKYKDINKKLFGKSPNNWKCGYSLWPTEK